MTIHPSAIQRLPAIALTLALAGPVPPTPSDDEDDGRRVIEVVARRFAFEPATIEAIIGEPIRLVIRSADGVHGFGLRSFDVNRTIPRGGSPVIIDLTPAAAGRFPFLCSEYCGSGHDDMRGTLVVHAAAQPSEAPARTGKHGAAGPNSASLVGSVGFAALRAASCLDRGNLTPTRGLQAVKAAREAR